MLFSNVVQFHFTFMFHHYYLWLNVHAIYIDKSYHHEKILLLQEQGKKSRSIRRNSHRSSVKNNDVFLPVVDAVHV